jgi:peptidoglycan/xylan/chitin deacetylase (PgdA/CDA1 family)
MILRRRFQQPVAFFCYPVGAFDPGVIQLVRDAGYTGAVTTVDGFATARGDTYTMPRIRVSGDEAPSVLLQSIRTAGG